MTLTKVSGNRDVKAHFPLGEWSIAGVLILVALATRAWNFGNPILHVDEQYYLLLGDRMLHGALPYVDLWDRKPIGLFLIYAAMRMVPGDGILAYQLIATGFAWATAMLVVLGARRLGAGRGAALAAGAAYLIWLPLLSGSGGQSPVFYDLFMTAGALLVLDLPARAARGERRAILISGAATCLLAGLAIQTKYTPLVEGAFFGLAHLFYLRRAGARWATTVAAGGLWATLGLLPTLAAIAWFAAQGRTAFDAFWFANFASVALRTGYPAAKIAARLAGTWAQLAPLVIGAILTLRRDHRAPTTRLAALWLAAALVGYAMIGAFFDHYALPLVAPLAMLAAPAWSRGRRALVATLALGISACAAKTALRPDDGGGIRALAGVVAAADARAEGRCPYVFAGDSAIYYLARACVPTSRAFPSTLAYVADAGASGVDPVAEIRRILANRPPAIVTLDRPLGAWNPNALALVTAALARDYTLTASAPREGGHELVYVRRPGQ